MAGPKSREEIIANAAMVKLNGGLDYFCADDILAVAGIDKPKLAQIKDTILDKVSELADDPDEII